MRVSVEKLFSHAAVDAPNVIADANNFSLVETHHGADTTLASYCSCWLKPLDMLSCHGHEGTTAVNGGATVLGL
jgi:hypothetical protein